MSQFVRIDPQAHLYCILRSIDSGGLEAVYCYDLRTGLPLGNGIGTRNSVGLPDEVKPAARDPQRDIKVVHTHPNSRENISLSAPDLRVLWTYPGIVEIDAVTLTGSWFRATRAPTDRDHATDSRFAMAAINRAVLAESALDLFENAPDDLKPFHDEAKTHIVCRALDRLGVITYTWSLVGDHRDLWEQCETVCRHWVDAVVREYRRQGW
jgi:hypothetical protein